MAKKLVLIGGGHAHLVTLAHIDTFISRGHEVKVIAPSEYHYYSGMGPGMMGMTYSPDDTRFATRKVVEDKGGTFILDTAVRIDPQRKTVNLISGKSVPYDILSCNTGSYVPKTGLSEDSDNIFTAKPIEKLLAVQKKITDRVKNRQIDIGIIGGGPSSAEIAGNILQLVKKVNGQKPVINIYAGNSFMKRFPSKVRKLVRHSLVRRGVKIIEDGYVNHVKSDSISLENGQTYTAELIFFATGVKPSPLFADSGMLVGPDGGMTVNSYLQSPDHPEIFGGGDCVYFEDKPLDKVGVYAVRQNPILYINLMSALEGRPLKAFIPGGKYLLIFNLGESDGVLHKSFFTFGGRIAFSIKNYIDRRFMKRFQAFEKVK